MLHQDAVPAAACRKTAGNCLRLAHTGKDEELSALPGRPVSGSTVPACLDSANQTGVVSTLVVALVPFSQATGKGYEVRLT